MQAVNLHSPPIMSNEHLIPVSITDQVDDGVHAASELGEPRFSARFQQEVRDNL